MSELRALVEHFFRHEFGRIDALRRERTHAQALPRLAEDAERECAPLEAHFADEIGDEPLRLLFVCCHEVVPAESRVALALRTLCGFSTAEIARACSPPTPTSR